MIKLVKSTFYKEKEIKEQLCKFIKDTEILSMNKEVKQFEEEFALWQNCKYAVMVNSGSSANLAVIQTMINLGKLKIGDKVGISALTWATNIFPVIQLGLKPIIIDVNINNLNIDINCFKSVLTRHDLKALFITHALGFCSEKLDIIKNICDKKNIILLEDTCESLGSKAYNKLLGNFGLASTFSFYVAHHLSTIEGGMICTDDKDVYNMLKMVRAHGWSKDLNKDIQTQLMKQNKINIFYKLFTFYSLGYNLRPTEINGFIGRKQLPYLDEICNIRHKNFIKINKYISENKNLVSFDLKHLSLISSFSIPILCKSKNACDKIKKKFIKAEIEVRPIISGNIQKQPVLINKNPIMKKNRKLPNADMIHECGFYIPNNPELTDEEIQHIIDVIKNA